MQVEEEVKQLKEEVLKLKKYISLLEKALYVTDEALDVVLNNNNLQVRNTTITDLFELKTVNQTSKTTVRYYFQQEYLLSAPEELKEELELEFNNLMNLRPKLSLEEVKSELRFYKEMLIHEEEIKKELPVISDVEEGVVS